VSPKDVSLEIKDPVDPSALEQARAILQELRPSGQIDPTKLIEVAQRLGDIPKDSTVVVATKEECKAAFDGLTELERTALVNIHARVKRFAEAQRASVQDMETDIPGGKAGHTVSPCKAAGCYAPGGRYPLPSSVIMTAVTARAAGCESVVLASPRPAPITLAAAHISNVDVMLCIGGAQAIACMAYGVDGINASCDVIVGPGNKWVTAAKSLVNGHCGIDMLAGPSEVLVICDDTANAEVVAADLIAQAEHDVVARAILLSTSPDMIRDVDKHVISQLESLPEPNKSTATEALKQSFAVQCDSIEQCIAISDDIAPEHLEIQTRDAWKVAQACDNYGGLFVGEHAAEVLGDYGAGPNHTLPTGGTGRYTGGLSVFNFLRIRTWMRIDDAAKSQSMVDDSITMARLEGLEGHARAAEARSETRTPAFKKAP
jgi:phosphoribosyl-ATP pyrophosphohydrolase/phosphoribosyl-AMP cyclohydrolase/histidinol dehydrogenase